MSPMRVLVTGGAGFIGSWLVESLLDSGHKVTVLDSLSAQIHGELPVPGSTWFRHPNAKFKRGDIRDAALVDELLGDCDALVHLAAETGTGQSMYQIGHYYEVNVLATARMLELIGVRHRHVRRVVLASSRSVYGEGAYEVDAQMVVPEPRSAALLEAGQWELLHSDGRPLRLIPTPEAAPPRPASIYAASKLAIEQLGSVFASSYDCAVTALRFQNVYGERQSLRNPYTGILSIFANRMRQNLPINIFEDGQESRDFVHVTDVVHSLERALQSVATGYSVFNIGSGRPTTVMAVANHLSTLLKSGSPLEVTGNYRAGDIRHCYADLTRAQEALGFAPRMTLESGLQRFVDWVLTQPVLEDRSEQAQREISALGLGKTTPNRC
jgi:dTDP-L-rhamnose 4-epimerase